MQIDVLPFGRGDLGCAEDDEGDVGARGVLRDVVDERAACHVSVDGGGTARGGGGGGCGCGDGCLDEYSVSQIDVS